VLQGCESFIGDVREINKAFRTLKNQYVDGRLWPLNRLLACLRPDAYPLYSARYLLEW
jgi:hypothetical protein